MQAGTEDVISDTPLNPSSIPALEASRDSNFYIYPWSTTSPYIVFNLRSPDSGGAMSKLLVRQAIEYGVGKIGRAEGLRRPGGLLGHQHRDPARQHRLRELQPVPGQQRTGNVAMCKSDLAKAGYPNGLTITYMYPNDSTNTRAFTAIQASLATCGITVKGKGEPGSTFFVDMGNAPSNNQPNQWDMGQVAWVPDWFGNNGRTVVQALFQGPNCVVNTAGRHPPQPGGSRSLITRADVGELADGGPGSAWHQADMDIMRDAAIVPLLQPGHQYSSSRVRGVGFSTAIFAPNRSASRTSPNIWLANG